MKPLPKSIEHTVRAYCEDYPRRKRAIAEGKLSPETLGHYMIVNARIDDAIASCCDESFCEEMREDIANHTGHRATRLTYLGVSTYKLRKQETKLAIARALHLL